ncbi:MAG: glycerol-3-phosphate dehydrogenase/oxidase [Acidobacteria bacterium]|nr:glycerol-3-phosphate dehydrogenase/oxidase [Acidobacteriota bacterium]
MGRIGALAQTGFDAAIIGGGIIGAGIARDLAMRGLSVALVEKRDFGGGTTSGSTRLIHGGLRYLEMLDFALVRMDLREREILLRIAPHLVKPLEFRIPFYSSGNPLRDLFQREKLRAGLLLYDLLSYDKSLPDHRFLPAREAAATEPGLRAEGLQSVASYSDAQVRMPERLCLENVLDAHRHGAVVRNYCEVTGRRPEGLLLRDAESGEEAVLRARVYVNATGAWFDRVNCALQSAPSSRLRTTKGIHLTCGPLVEHAHALFSPVDGRLFFVIPLLGNTWIGTTDTDFPGDPFDARAERADVEYLYRSAEAYFPAVRGLPLHSTTSGVRALVKQGGSESSVSRVHKIEHTAPDTIAVLGGKITGYRAIAEEAAGTVCRDLRHSAKCRTATEPLPGAAASDSLYGSRQSDADRLGTATLAAREEFCVHIDDYMFRRAPFAFHPGLGAAHVDEAMAALSAELQWSASRQAAERRRLEDACAAIRPQTAERA